jgi:hypothetical protein
VTILAGPVDRAESVIARSYVAQYTWSSAAKAREDTEDSTLDAGWRITGFAQQNQSVTRFAEAPAGM